MSNKKLTPQAKWNHKHPKNIRATSRRYYLKHRTKILRKLKIRYAKRKMEINK